MRKFSSKEVPIYVLSVIGALKTEKIMQNIGADYYSIKPISPKNICENIQFLLKIRDMHPESFDRKETYNEAVVPSLDISKQVDSFLYDLGASMYRVPTMCLKQALKLGLCDEFILTSTLKLYKPVGEDPNINKSGAVVERNIRSAIKHIHEVSNGLYREYFLCRTANQ